VRLEYTATGIILAGDELCADDISDYFLAVATGVARAGTPTLSRLTGAAEEGYGPHG
jgi:hypothetical protein